MLTRRSWGGSHFHDGNPCPLPWQSVSHWSAEKGLVNKTGPQSPHCHGNNSLHAQKPNSPIILFPPDITTITTHSCLKIASSSCRKRSRAADVTWPLGITTDNASSTQGKRTSVMSLPDQRCARFAPPRFGKHCLSMVRSWERLSTRCDRTWRSRLGDVAWAVV